MALPRVFAALTSALMSYLDDDFNAVGALTTLQTTSSGTNAVTLTPAANAPSIAAYGLPNPVRFGFQAPSTSTGAVTLRINALAFLKVFLPSGVQANTGDLTANGYYEVVYLASLDTGAGGWIIASSLPGTGAAPVSLGSAKGLVVTNNAGTPATKIDITASRIVPVTSTGSPVFLTSFSATVDLTTTGLNGMDTGARPANGWVYIYALSNGTLTGAIATTTSPTAGSFSPTPTGYIYSAFVGAMWCDGSQNLMRSKQQGRHAQYIIGTNPTNSRNMATGVAGTFSTTSPTLASITVTSYVPLTAGVIYGQATAGLAGGTGSSIVIAPNTSWGGVNNGPSGSGGNIYPLWINAVTSTWGGSFVMALEGTTIAWASAAAGGGVACLGWDDYYVNA